MHIKQINSLTLRFGLAAAVIAVSSAIANAASPEDAYFAARDATIIQIGKLTDSGVLGDAYGKPYDAAAAKLEQLLRPMIGPVVVKGFTGDGKLNLGSLAKGDEGFGTLDGLVFSSPNAKSDMIATTGSLLRHWLVEHKTWWEADQDNVPQAPELALKSDAFYTQAIQTDAAIIRFAELPIAQPANTSAAFAMLDGRTQDDTVGLAPDEIIVAVLASDRLFIGIVPTHAKFAAAPACAKAREAADKKIQTAEDAFTDGGRKNAALGEKVRKLRDDADNAQGVCLSAKVKAQKGYADALAQAQGLANDMAGASK